MAPTGGLAKRKPMQDANIPSSACFWTGGGAIACNFFDVLTTGNNRAIESGRTSKTARVGAVLLKQAGD